MSARPALLVLIPLSGADESGVPLPLVVAAFACDVREWQPHMPGDPRFEALLHNATATTGVLPAAVGPGSYTLGVWLPDAARASESDGGGSGASAFAVRLANDDVSWWTGTGRGSWGVNTIANITVLPAAGGGVTLKRAASPAVAAAAMAV